MSSTETGSKGGGGELFIPGAGEEITLAVEEVPTYHENTAAEVRAWPTKNDQIAAKESSIGGNKPHYDEVIIEPVEHPGFLEMFMDAIF